MASSAFAAPLTPGKTQEWRQWSQEMVGPRQSEYKASRQRVRPPAPESPGSALLSPSLNLSLVPHRQLELNGHRLFHGPSKATYLEFDTYETK